MLEKHFATVYEEKKETKFNYTRKEYLTFLQSWLQEVRHLTNDVNHELKKEAVAQAYISDFIDSIIVFQRHADLFRVTTQHLLLSLKTIGCRGKFSRVTNQLGMAIRNVFGNIDGSSQCQSQRSRVLEQVCQVIRLFARFVKCLGDDAAFAF